MRVFILVFIFNLNLSVADGYYKQEECIEAGLKRKDEAYKRKPNDRTGFSCEPAFLIIIDSKTEV